MVLPLTALANSVSSQDKENVLSEQMVNKILDQAESTANGLLSLLRVDAEGKPQTCRMELCVSRIDEMTMDHRSMDGAWFGSISIAKSKAFTAMAFSSDENALTSHSIGLLSQPDGDLWQIGNSNREHGIIEFPGSVPLYINGKLVGGLGVSGDGVNQDEIVAIAGATGFEPPEAIRIDTVTGGAVPYTL